MGAHTKQVAVKRFFFPEGILDSLKPSDIQVLQGIQVRIINNENNNNNNDNNNDKNSYNSIDIQVLQGIQVKIINNENNNNNNYYNSIENIKRAKWFLSK